jgi:hypothetical protein
VCGSHHGDDDTCAVHLTMLHPCHASRTSMATVLTPETLARALNLVSTRAPTSAVGRRTYDLPNKVTREIRACSNTRFSSLRRRLTRYVGDDPVRTCYYLLWFQLLILVAVIFLLLVDVNSYTRPMSTIRKGVLLHFEYEV